MFLKGTWFSALKESDPHDIKRELSLDVSLFGLNRLAGL